MRFCKWILCLGLFGCSQSVKISNSQFDSISGSISGISSSSLNKTSNSTLSSCVAESVKLYSLNSTGGEGEFISETTIDKDGKFTFSGLSEKGIILSRENQDSTKYLLRFSCGSEILNRFVTGPVDQDLDYGTTIVAWLSQTQESSQVLNVETSVWSNLYKGLQGATSVENAYSLLINNQILKNQVKDKLDVDPEVLNEAAPIVRSVQVPQSFNEEAVNSLAALVHHWSPTYNFAYEWRLNGELLSNAVNYNYAPPANKQGHYTLQFFVGSNNGSGLIDTTKPYFQKIFDITINNSVLPAAPSMVRLSSAETASTTQSVRIATGAVLGSTFQNCRTFSHMALLEESSFLPALPPTNPSLFTYDCSSAGTQTISFNSDGTEGSRVLRLWTMDEAGVVSATPSEVYFHYDVTAPVLAFTSPVASTEAQSGVNVTGSCESGLTVHLAGAGITTTSASCVSSAFSAAVSFTAVDGTKAVSLSQTDAAGNTGSVSRNFIKDTIAPVLAFTSPAALTEDQTGVTVTGSCESGLTVNLAGAGITATSASCVGSVFSAAVIFTSGDGTKAVSLSQTDAAGNTGSVSRNFIKDSTSPVLAFTSPAALTEAQTGVTVAGSCETGLTVNLAGAGITATTTSCMGSVFSSPVTFTSGDGSKAVTISQTDSAGNIGLVSRDYVKDTTAPVLAFASPAALTEAQSGVTVTGSCETGLTVNLAGAGITATSTSCVGAAFSAAVSFTAVDGTKAVNISQTDAAGNTGSASRNFVKDTTVPTVTITSPVALTPSQSGVTINGACEIGLTLNFSGSGIVATSASCVTGSYSQAVTWTAGDGTKTATVSQTDSAGNVGSVSRNFVKDTAAPVLSVSSPVAATAAQSGLTLSGSCETGLTITLDGSGIVATSAACTAAAFSAAITFSAGDGTKVVNLSQTDASGNVGSTSTNFIKDATAPTLASMTINGGVTTTGNRNVLISFTASSDRVDIESFCIKSNDTIAPAGGDSCWRTLTSVGGVVTNNASISNYPFQTGAILGLYDMRVWMKDALGNISANASTLNVDLFTINYSPDPAASVSNLIAASSDAPSSPLTSSDTSVLLASDVYVYWSITDNNAIPSGNIKIYYTTDEVNYTLLQSGLNNSANGSCTLTGVQTGCVKLTAASPLSSYYKIKVEVTDSGASVSYSATNPLNTGQFNLLTGNTSLGIGGSAISSILLGRYEKDYNDNADPQNMAVTKSGHIFFNYLNKGLAYISPETGFIQILIPVTGTTAGDGGAATAATLKAINKMTLDKDDNLLIWDSNRIRKVLLSSTPWQISTIVGGGASTVDGALATAAAIPTLAREGLFAAFPNGRIYFENGLKIWYFDPTDSTVRVSLTLSGTGIGNMSGAFANYDNSYCSTRNTSIAFDKTTSAITKIMRQGSESADPLCGSVTNATLKTASFNPTTGVAAAPHPPDTAWSSLKFTGNDGKMYVLEQGRSRLLRYNPTTNTYDVVISGSAPGRCVDGTLATACPAVVMSAYVNEFGRVYFLDMGVIRLIDDSGRVQTLAGQPRNYGVGVNPVSARYSQINYFSVDGDDVYVLNKLENQLVKFSLTGGNLVNIAGNSLQATPTNGSVAANSPLQNCGWGTPCGFIVDGTARRLYHRVSDKYAYIDLNTGLWNVSAYQLQDSSSRVSYVGLGPSGPLTYIPSHFGVAGNKLTVREINTAGPSDNIIYGSTTISTTLASDLCTGAVGTTCTMQATLDDAVQMQYKFDSATNNWLLGYKGKNYLNILPLGGGVTSRLEVMARTFVAFDIKRDADLWVYYCGTDGKLYKRNTTTDVETNLPLPSTTITCAGQALHYHSGRDSLIFIFKQNDLYGVAEYKNP